MHRIERMNLLPDTGQELFMAKAPRLGKLHTYFPKWWHKAEPKTVALESFQPKPDPSSDQQEESRLQKLAEIALHDANLRYRNTNKAA